MGRANNRKVTDRGSWTLRLMWKRQQEGCGGSCPKWTPSEPQQRPLHTVGGSAFLAACIWTVHHDAFMMCAVLPVYSAQYAYVDVLSPRNGVSYCSSSVLAIHSNYTCIGASKNKLFTLQGTLVLWYADPTSIAHHVKAVESRAPRISQRSIWLPLNWTVCGKPGAKDPTTVFQEISITTSGRNGHDHREQSVM